MGDGLGLLWVGLGQRRQGPTPRSVVNKCASCGFCYRLHQGFKDGSGEAGGLGGAVTHEDGYISGGVAVTNLQLRDAVHGDGVQSFIELIFRGEPGVPGYGGQLVSVIVVIVCLGGRA